MNKHWILLRGLGRDKRHWGAFVQQFQQTFSHDQVSAIDTCGNGDFSCVSSPLSIAEYTEHCRQQLNKAIVWDKAEKIHLVGLSLGGMIALDWAQRFPNEVQSMTLINSSVANLTPWYQRINLSALVRLANTVIGHKSSKIIEQAILQVSSNLPIQPHTLKCWTEYREAQATSLLNLIRQLIAASRFKAYKSACITPLILNSKVDRLVNCRASEDIYRYLGGHIIVHPTAGHDLPLDDSVWVIQQIKRHIDVS